MTTTLIDALAGAISLSHMSNSHKINECRHKLTNTFVMMDGHPVQIGDLSGGVLSYVNHNNSHREIVLDAWVKADLIQLINIDSGVYFLKGFPVYLKKRVKKSYKKSFCPENYSYHLLDNNISRLYPDGMVYRDFIGKKREGIYTYNNHIWYLNHCLASYKNGKIDNHLTMFADEILEAIRNGAIEV